MHHSVFRLCVCVLPDFYIRRPKGMVVELHAARLPSQWPCSRLCFNLCKLKKKNWLFLRTPQDLFGREWKQIFLTGSCDQLVVALTILQKHQPFQLTLCQKSIKCISKISSQCKLIEKHPKQAWFFHGPGEEGCVEVDKTAQKIISALLSNISDISEVG